MKQDKRPKPRWLQHLIATLGGYFWLPCPSCGEPFGGHEPDGKGIDQGNGRGLITCANC